MNELNKTVETNEVRLEWIEPAVRTLDVRETAANKNPGADGSTRSDDSAS